MSNPLVDRIPFPKILIGLSILLLISMGLCGLTALSAGHGQRAHMGVDPMLEKMLLVGVVGAIVSIVGIPVIAVIWVMMTVVSRLTRKDSEPH